MLLPIKLPNRIAEIRTDIVHIEDECDRCCSDDPPWNRIQQGFGYVEELLARLDALQEENDVLRPPAQSYNRTLARAEAAEARLAALRLKIEQLPRWDVDPTWGLKEDTEGSCVKRTDVLAVLDSASK